MDAAGKGSAALIDALKNLQLRPTSWPEHQLRSVRSIRLQSSANNMRVISYVVPPANQNEQP